MLYHRELTDVTSITIIAFTGDHDAQYILSEYRKMDSVEKMFLSSKVFAGGEPLKVQITDALRGHMFVTSLHWP